MLTQPDPPRGEDEVIIEALRQADARHREAVEAAEVLDAMVVDQCDLRLQRFVEIARGFVKEAEDHIIRTILATDPDFKPRRLYDSPLYHNEPRGVVLGDHLYLALSDEQAEGSPEGRVRLTHLYRVPLSSILGKEGRREPALTEAQRSLLFVAQALGDEEATQRLLLKGPYEAIGEVIARLGADAFEELRRMIRDRPEGGDSR